jgi:membrane fusion protein (multidrug efflux system)
MKLFQIAIIFALFISGAVNAQDKKGPPTTPVIVTEVKQTSFADEVEALGTLKANESVDLASSVTELVTGVSFVDNQRVGRGDVIVEMDAAEELAELAEEQSIMDEAQRQVDRLTPLVKRGAASASVLDEYNRDLAGAAARIEAIQSRIDQRTIKAPFDGVLGLRNISVGTLAQPGSMITTIDDDSVMKLDFSVPEIFLATLKKGIIINAKTEAYPDRIFKGTIESVDSRIDPITRSIQARAIIDNTDGVLKPGLLMQVVLNKNPRTGILIPEESVMVSGVDSYVFVVKESTVEKRAIKLGQRQFGTVEILSGLELGEQIVTHGTLRIRDGDTVDVQATEKDNESLSDLLNTTQTKAAQ